MIVLGIFELKAVWKVLMSLDKFLHVCRIYATSTCPPMGRGGESKLERVVGGECVAIIKTMLVLISYTTSHATFQKFLQPDMLSIKAPGHTLEEEQFIFSYMSLCKVNDHRARNIYIH